MKKVILPTICFAVLSTTAFEKAVFAENPKSLTTIVSNHSALKTTIRYVNVSTGSSLNLRKSVSTNSSIVAKLAKGAPVTVYSEANGWAKIKANGLDGFVSSQFLSASKPSVTSSPSATTNTAPTAKPTAAPVTTKYVNVSAGSSLNMRKNASSNASIIIKLSRGIPVTVYSEEKGWARIKVYGQEGFVSSQYITKTIPSSVSSSNGQPKETPSVIKFVNISNGSSLNMYNSASSSSSVIAKLDSGAQVIVYSENNGWTNIKANGKDGYVSSKFLSSSKPTTKTASETITTKYVNISPKSSLTMRNNPSPSASIMVQLARGVQVSVYSEENGWTKIKVYNQFGYVSSEYLSATKPGTIDTDTNMNTSKTETVLKFVNVNSGSNLNMRSEAADTSSVLAQLSSGTVVTVLDEKNGWSRVTANGRTGYVHSEYLAIKAPATVKKDINYTYENLNMTLNEMTAIQYHSGPQTDKQYHTYLREDALIVNNPSNPVSGIVKGSGWNIRGGAGTDYWTVGTVNGGEHLQILSKKLGSDGHYWFEVNYEKSWVNASPDDTKYYLDPHNFVKSSVDSYQFLKLSQTTNLDSKEVNKKILSGKGILEGHASTFIYAAEKYGINEMYLISHALLETGNGTSQLANGIQLNGKTVYNMYGIGAYDNSALTSGVQYAYNAGWFTPEDAIIGGAKFIAQGYIDAGQDTLYKMRWNPSMAATAGYATHQYATDIGWAAKQVKQIYNLYTLLDSYQLTLDIPQYK
ncbi:SH3 domain-containing protein [Neobacillus ginsengisoli]|uniref:Beta-N-acetylglucosaminidase/uncharacterized protein YgiM (DUF1202 family) n=1 Tax=Neobacillus ginsengisoli TaxID=904295 RepID=A0ABT9XUT9_9BACI|nr:SH3 domain-containing protein [Neobacillus ginsengisoli]MDQ0199322.1 beta-N-acetylglucosaminidase/uncharacterized protein YgiM (DUF1202 family) [Neobacillus ginsengisoli]